VNAIGSNPTHCAENYWQDTAIFILWDDWGGWYDHVPPYKLLRPGDGRHDCDTPGLWGCGYTYGFRVPLLVVSAFTPAGYVSGSIAQGGPGMQGAYIHDFGSLLAFIENNFTLGHIAAPGYADANAPDGGNNNIPLSDFFTLTTPRDFVPISSGHSADFFTNYFTVYAPGEVPAGPDPDETD